MAKDERASAVQSSMHQSQKGHLYYIICIKITPSGSDALEFFVEENRLHESGPPNARYCWIFFVLFSAFLSTYSAMV